MRSVEITSLESIKILVPQASSAGGRRSTLIQITASACALTLRDDRVWEEPSPSSSAWSQAKPMKDQSIYMYVSAS
jgi:hypothetical protein